jgi:multiple sugar transport system substrate-binding protein
MRGLARGARLAAVAATIALTTAGCAGSARDTAAVTPASGIGPITFATGKLDTGYLPRLVAEASLGYDEAASARAFESGKLLFLRNWPYVYGGLSTPGPATRWSARSG